MTHFIEIALSDKVRFFPKEIMYLIININIPGMRIPGFWRTLIEGASKEPSNVRMLAH